MIQKLKILLLALIFPAICFSQETGSLKGKVLDSKDSLPLFNATVLIKGENIGSSTDINGFFQINKIFPGKKTLNVSFIGYKTKLIDIQVERNNPNIIITLEEDQLRTEEVIVTAGKREQSLKEIPVSVSIVDAKALFERNVQTFDDALRYIPGVNMTEYQINIRGSSGYSRGVGNRVLLLLDGLPMLSGDTGEMKFDVVSISQIDKVEVVKGAGSTLYGSSALGGIVNIITKEPKEELSLNSKIYSGMYDKPQYSEWKWSDNARFYNGIDLNYSQKFGSLGLIASFGLKNNDGYREDDDSKKKNAFIKAKYNLDQNNILTLSSSYAYDDRGNYIVWQDVSNALRPDRTMTYPGERIFSTKYFLNTGFKHIISDISFLNIKANYFYTFFENNQVKNQNSTAGVYNAEAQYVTSVISDDFLTAGVAFGYNLVSSGIFGERSGYTLGAYLQEEIPFNNNFKLTGGLRYDLSQITDGENEESISPKLGLSYQPYDGTSFRASIGSGFRTPSIGEKFSNTTSGGIIIEPNPDLKPEKSFSYEIGGSHIISSFMSIDLALFRNQYEDLIEPVVSPVSGKVSFQNITKAHIQGFEAAVKYQAGFISGDISYTYMDPYDETEESILKFRSKHLLYFNTSLSYDKYSFSFDYRYISKIEKTDALLAKIIKSAQVRVPIHVVDLRASYSFYKFKILFNINNLLNYNYVEVVGNLSPIRNYALILEFTL